MISSSMYVYEDNCLLLIFTHFTIEGTGTNLLIIKMPYHVGTNDNENQVRKEFNEQKITPKQSCTSDKKFLVRMWIHLKNPKCKIGNLL